MSTVQNARPSLAFQVGPYCCIPLAEAGVRAHVPVAVVRREQAGGQVEETRLTFDEEGFDTPEEALAYAAARADFLLRFEPASVVAF